jgi:hypothetical protein
MPAFVGITCNRRGLPMSLTIATQCRLLAVLLAISRGAVPSEAATFKVSSVHAPSAYQLQTFVAGGITYSQADLIHPSVTAYSGRGGLQIPEGEPIPSASTRTQLITGDFKLNTGVSNTQQVQFTFSPALINGPGPDLVYLNEGYFGPADLDVTVGGAKVFYAANFYDARLLFTNYYQYFRNVDSLINLAQLEADPYLINPATSGPSISYVSGLAIDLDDFSVAPMAAVSDVTFGRPSTSPDSLDPLLLMGIRSTIVPEPTTLPSVAAIIIALAWRRARRRRVILPRHLSKSLQADSIAGRVAHALNRGGYSRILCVLCCGLAFLVFSVPSSSAAKIYWTSRVTGKIERANVDGSQVEDVVTGLVGNYGLAIDDVHRRVYWSDINNGSISRANLDGTGRQTLVTGRSSPLTIRLDVAGGVMYWNERFSVMRSMLDGANPIKLLTTTWEGQGLAIDTAANKMYLSSWPAGNIQRANLDGTGLVNLPARPGTEGLELDRVHSKLYLSNYDQRTIGRTELDGTGFELLVQGQTGIEQVALDVAAGKMYWGAGGSIRCANLDGTNLQTLVPNAPGVDSIRLVLDSVPEPGSGLLFVLSLLPFCRRAFGRRLIRPSEERCSFTQN